MEGLGEILATLVGIILFGAPVLGWALYSWLRRRARGRRTLASEIRSTPKVPAEIKSASEDPNWLNRIKESAEQETAEAADEPVSEFDTFDAIPDSTRLGSGVGGAHLSSESGEPLARVPAIPMQSAGEGVLTVSADASMRPASGSDAWDRINRLPRLKRAIVLSEILGRPVSLRDED